MLENDVDAGTQDNVSRGGHAVGDLNSGLMLVQDLFHHWQAESSAGRFGGDVRFKGFREDAFAEANTVVFNSEPNGDYSSVI